MTANNSTNSLSRLIDGGPNNCKVSILHIGGRGGYIPFTFPSLFDPEIRIVLVDAAKDAVTSRVFLSDRRSFGGMVDPLHAAISSSTGEVSFLKTACPFASGIKPFNPEFSDWYSFGNGNVDYILGEAHQVLDTEVVRCDTLDSLAEAGIIPNTPTVLSIDTQGASLEIISGGHDFITRNAHVIVCEAELINFYGGAPSFAQILQLLSDWGFLFFGFLPSSTTWASPARRPVGQRGRTHRGSEDAVFIRAISHTAHLSPVSQEAYVLLCHLFGSVEAGVHLAHSFKVKEATGPISQFAQEIRDVSVYPKRLPLSFSQKRSLNAAPSETYQRLFGHFLSTVGMVRSKDYPPIGWSRYEKCLRKWGMKELARVVRSLRRQQYPHSQEPHVA